MSIVWSLIFVTTSDWQALWCRLLTATFRWHWFFSRTAINDRWGIWLYYTLFTWYMLIVLVRKIETTCAKKEPFTQIMLWLQNKQNVTSNSTCGEQCIDTFIEYHSLGDNWNRFHKSVWTKSDVIMFGSIRFSYGRH